MAARLFAILLAVLPGAAWADDTASLTVTVEHVSDKGGDLRIGVFTQAQFEVRGTKPMMGKIEPAAPGTMRITFDKVPPGVYGVKVLQDVNRDGHMDLAMRMIPTEPWGLSNDPDPGMHVPKFDDAKFIVKPGANAIAITLK